MKFGGCLVKVLLSKTPFIRMGPKMNGSLWWEKGMRESQGKDKCMSQMRGWIYVGGLGLRHHVTFHEGYSG